METAAEGRGLATDSLEGFLLDFEQAVRDFEQRGSSPYDSGIDDSGSKSISPSSSLDSSQEDLTAAVASSHTPSSTAKLGDTRELEAFIADLDQILKEM
ncbi:PREDICTED: regulator of cell cycle RGCC isoform X2 [Thamnophis sirtalis]|uniref:Regulator of cell cycle RGCC isoform X2 n=1 Tax=Thamnophis sirtalis TaxID=35019 RepID=A0A6I9YFS5_9SAUR|nr:PREDICTED: regulator of cell cycle RGCC isoform X2 [Thamnophis sirtalis]